MIRLAEKKDLEEIYSLTKACAVDMISKDIYQWNENYPSEEKLSTDIERGELYCIDADSKIAGIIIITEIEDEEYQGVKWLESDGNCVYVHRLAVHPEFQGKGYAQQLMDFAESYASAMGYSSVRLDTFSQNKRNNVFYSRRGYVKLDDIYFLNQSEDPFHCYELIISE